MSLRACTETDVSSYDFFVNRGVELERNGKAFINCLQEQSKALLNSEEICSEAIDKVHKLCERHFSLIQSFSLATYDLRPCLDPKDVRPLNTDFESRFKAVIETIRSVQTEMFMLIKSDDSISGSAAKEERKQNVRALAEGSWSGFMISLTAVPPFCFFGGPANSLFDFNRRVVALNSTRRDASKNLESAAIPVAFTYEDTLKAFDKFALEQKAKEPLPV